MKQVVSLIAVLALCCGANEDASVEEWDAQCRVGAEGWGAGSYGLRWKEDAWSRFVEVLENGVVTGWCTQSDLSFPPACADSTERVVMVVRGGHLFYETPGGIADVGRCR